MCAGICNSWAQLDSTRTILKNIGIDTTAQETVESMDSIILNSTALDTSQLDSLSSDSLRSSSNVKLSPDAIDIAIEYGSRDSMIMDNVNRLVHLHGEAYVNYGERSLKAGYILLDLNTNLALAKGVRDSLDELIETPVFTDNQQEIEAVKMRYNFKTRKGLVYDVTTVEGDLHVRSEMTKFYGSGGSTGREHHHIYSLYAIATTCDADHPHFGIRSKKQKVVPDKVAVVGPSNLEIGGVPTPLYLPFGFFPLKNTRRAGLMFPNNYEYSDRWGFGLANVGYYLPISDNLDLTVLTDFYFRGSYAIDGEVRYKKRYKYSGNIQVGFSRYQTERVVNLENGQQDLRLSRDKSFSLRLRHNQSPTANPYRTIGGSINIESNQYDNLNFNNARNVLNNTLNSNFSLTQIIPGSPVTVTLGLTHSQNTSTRSMRMSLPRLDIRMKQINPFKKKRRTGPEKWFEKIALSYQSTLRYDLNGIDTTFFEAETFDNGKFGVEHRISSNVNFNLFKYFQLSPFVNFRETWYTKSSNADFIDSVSVVLDTIFNALDSTDFTVSRDTISFGRLETNRISDFNAIHQVDAGLSLFTKVYGTMRFRRGWLRGLRHTIKPSISLSYTPDYTRPELGYFDSYVRKNDQGEEELVQYSVFQDEIFGGPSSGGERLSLNYSLLNLFEAKVFSKRDSTTKKFSLLDNLNVSGSYNFSADTLHWSPISASGNLRLFNGITQMKIGASFDPYAVDERGRRINTFERDVSGKFLRFNSATFSLNSSVTMKDIMSAFGKKKKKEDHSENTLLGIFEGLRFTHQFTIRSRQLDDGRIIFEPSIHSIAVRGSLPLSPKWNLNVGQVDYNFVRKGTSYPDLSLSRDLHCWSMGISWFPERNTYNFYIRVKPGSLDFINLPYSRNREDGFQNL